MTLGDGLLEASRQRNANGLNISITLPLPPIDTEGAGIDSWFVKPDPTRFWAEHLIFDQIMNMLQAQLNVLPHRIAPEVFFDEDEVHELRNHDSVLDLLEGSTAEGFIALLRAPDVVDGMESIRRDGSVDQRRRLAKVMKRRMPAPRGVPRKPVENRKDLATARRVAELGCRLEQAFKFMEQCRTRKGYASDPEVIAREFDAIPGVKPEWATHLARRRTTSLMAVCRIVADETRSTPKAVYKAAERGWKHPDFRLPVCSDQ
jgi:hypothetical protein